MERSTSLQPPQPFLAQITYSHIPERAPAQEQRSCRIRRRTCSYRTSKPSVLRSSGTMTIWPSSTPSYSFCARALAYADSTWGLVLGNSCAGSYQSSQACAYCACASQVLPTTTSTRSFAGFRRRCKRSMSRVPYLTVSWCVFLFPHLPTLLTRDLGGK